MSLFGASVLRLCFFLSGFASLVLEVVWSRELRLVFGSTSLSVSTILVAYMLGLGLGGLVGGRLAERVWDRTRAYGFIELGVATYSLAVPLILLAFPWVGRQWLYALPFWPAALCRFALSVLIFLLPTLLMGATLPLLVGAVVRRQERVGREIALLYGLNTCGAVAGALTSAFVLLPVFGLRGAAMVAACIAALAGLLALAVGARRSHPARTDRGVEAGKARAERGRTLHPAVSKPEDLSPFLGSYGLIGFTALVYEVAWTRALVMVLGSSIYAFATMLGAFLSGIALGSLLMRRLSDTASDARVLYSLGVGALGLVSILTMIFLGLLPQAFVRVVTELGPSRPGIALTHMLLAMSALLPPTILLGALFPLLSRLLAGASSASRAVGDVYFVNTLGAATGAFAGGFVLIPWLGLRDTLALASGLNLATAGVLLLWKARGVSATRWAGATLLIASVGIPLSPLPWRAEDLARGVYMRVPEEIDVGVEPLPLRGVAGDELVFYREGVNGTVSVHRSHSQLVLRINGKPEASTSDDMPTQVLSGHIPMLFGHAPSRVLVVGHGSGVSVGSVARHPAQTIDVVEIEPAVLEASRLFDRESGAPLEDPRVRTVLDDGRTYLSYSRQRYDVIVSEPSNPWITGVSNLFTREFFASAKAALRPGGRLLQWVQLYGMDRPALLALLAALRAEFPYVYGFSHTRGRGDLLLLARLEPLTRDELPRWSHLPESVREDLRRTRVYCTEDLWSLVRLVPADIDALVADAPATNSDRNLFVELRAPLTLYSVTLETSWEAIARFPDGVLPLLADVGEPLDAERLGALAFSYARQRSDTTVASRLLGLALARGASAHALATEAYLNRDTLTPSERLSRLDAAVALRPDARPPRMLRAEARLEMGQYEGALADVETVLRDDPQDWRLRQLRATLLQSAGRHREAASELHDLLAHGHLERDAELLRAAGESYLALERLPEAIDALERSARIEPNFAYTWGVLSTAYERAGLASEADRARENLGIVRRNRLLMLHSESRRAIWMGSREFAIERLLTALALDPTYEPARNDLDRLTQEEAGSRPP